MVAESTRADEQRRKVRFVNTGVSRCSREMERAKARAAVRNDDGRFLNGFRRLFDHDAASHDAASDLLIFRGVALFDCCCWRRPPGRPACSSLPRSRIHRARHPAAAADNRETHRPRPRARVPAIYSRLCSALVTGERFDPEISCVFSSMSYAGHIRR